jgi:hypothetical protein
MTQRRETPMEPDEGLWQHMFIDKDLDDAGLLPTEFRVYAHLCRRADKKTHTAWPGVDSMAGTIRANRTTIIDAIEELEARGFIKVSRQIGRRSNYEILPKYCWQPKSNQSEIGNGNQLEIRNGAFPKTDGAVPQKRPPPVGNRERKYYHRRKTKKKNKEEVVADAPPHSCSDFFGFDKAKPANQNEIITFFETDQTCIGAYVDKADAIAFWCTMEEQAWTTHNGKKPVKDWKATARKYATKRWLPSGELSGRDREEHVRKMKEHADLERRFAESERLREKTEQEAREREKRERLSQPFRPPELADFLDYGLSIGISETDCRDQFEIWAANDWKDGNGTLITNWKWVLCLNTLKK